MEQSSVEDLFNWSITRAQMGGPGGAYNWGLPVIATEIPPPYLPKNVLYNDTDLTARITFSLTQNSTANGTIDPSHLVFKFYGKDAYGKAIDLSADEFSGISKIV